MYQKKMRFHCGNELLNIKKMENSWIIYGIYLTLKVTITYAYHIYHIHMHNICRIITLPALKRLRNRILSPQIQFFFYFITTMHQQWLHHRVRILSRNKFYYPFYWAGHMGFFFILQNQVDNAEYGLSSFKRRQLKHLSRRYVIVRDTFDKVKVGHFESVAIGFIGDSFANTHTHDLLILYRYGRSIMYKINIYIIY